MANGLSDSTQARIDAAMKAAGLASKSDVQSIENPAPAPKVDEVVLRDDKAPGKRQIQIADDETGDTYDVEIDDADVQGSIRDYVLKAKRADVRESEIKAMRDEYAGRKSALEIKEKEVQKLLAGASSDAEVREILELVKNKGNIEEYKRKIIDEHAKYVNMSVEEKREFDSQRERADSLKREKSLQDRLDTQLKKQEQREGDLKRQEKLVMYKSGFKVNSFENPSADPAIDRINRTIFNQVSETLAQMEKEGVTLTDAIISREFKKEYNMLSKMIKPGSKSKSEEVRETIDAIDNSASKMQAAGNGKKSGGETQSDVIARWREMLSKGQGAQIVKEAQSSKALMDLYVKEGRNLIQKGHKPAGNNSHIKWK